MWQMYVLFLSTVYIYVLCVCTIQKYQLYECSGYTFVNYIVVYTSCIL